VLVALVGISVTRNADLFKTISVNMYAAACLLGVLGMSIGALMARLSGLSVAQRRTVSFETGVQNSPLCLAILVSAFPTDQQLSMLKLPLLYALFVLIEASIVTLVYRALDARREGAALIVASEPEAS
jgi:predicted Na+-dependent transporter